MNNRKVRCQTSHDEPAHCLNWRTRVTGGMAFERTAVHQVQSVSFEFKHSNNVFILRNELSNLLVVLLH